MNFTNEWHRFPKINVPYESIIHKELPDSLFIAQPFGRRCYLWFTYYQTRNVCFVVDDHSIYPVPMSFHHTLSYGTVLYGTMTTRNKTSCFVMDDVFLFKGHHLDGVDYNSKLDIFNTLLTECVCPNIYIQTQTVVMLPAMALKQSELKAPYKVYGVRTINLHGATKYYKYKSPNKSFVVKPTLKSDTYELYEDGKFHSIAFIDTYKRSVMMNDLFRRIYENHNLDLIEESDTEEEFENTEPSKYVLDKEIEMECTWNVRFKKWVPVSVC